MLAMAVQPNLNVSLKPLAFPSQKIKTLLEKASIFANPISKTTTLSNLKLSSHCHTHTYTPTTKLVKPIWASATAEATVAEEHTVSDDDFISQSPPDKEVSLTLTLSLSLSMFVWLMVFFFFKLILTTGTWVLSVMFGSWQIGKEKMENWYDVCFVVTICGQGELSSSCFWVNYMS